MPKPIVLLAGAGAVVVIGGAILLMTNKSDTPSTDKTDTKTGSSSTVGSQSKLNDPSGDYDFLSDASITKHPEKGVKFGNGQTYSVDYDGTKTNNDEYATLSYQLYYIQDDGKVQPMGGGNMDGKGKGTFSTSDKVFNSNAKGYDGFFEVTGTYTVGTSGTNVQLGMYPISFDVTE